MQSRDIDGSVVIMDLERVTSHSALIRMRVEICLRLIRNGCFNRSEYIKFSDCYRVSLLGVGDLNFLLLACQRWVATLAITIVSRGNRGVHRIGHSVVHSSLTFLLSKLGDLTIDHLPDIVDSILGSVLVLFLLTTTCLTALFARFVATSCALQSKFFLLIRNQGSILFCEVPVLDLMELAFPSFQLKDVDRVLAVVFAFDVWRL